MKHPWEDFYNGNHHLNHPLLDRSSMISSNRTSMMECSDINHNEWRQLSTTHTRVNNVVQQRDGQLIGFSQTSLDQGSHGITSDILNGTKENVFSSSDHHDQISQPQSQHLQLSDGDLRFWPDVISLTADDSQILEEVSFHNSSVGSFDEILPIPLSRPISTQDAQPDSSTSILAHTPSQFSPSINGEHQANRTMIGSMYSTNQPDGYVFECAEPRCYNRTFSRWYDFKRHYNGEHAERRTEFWCRVPECNRSMAAGGRPFPRKDKMRDHVRKAHGA